MTVDVGVCGVDGFAKKAHADYMGGIINGRKRDEKITRKKS